MIDARRGTGVGAACWLGHEPPVIHRDIHIGDNYMGVIVGQREDSRRAKLNISANVSSS